MPKRFAWNEFNVHAVIFYDTQDLIYNATLTIQMNHSGINTSKLKCLQNIIRYAKKKTNFMSRLKYWKTCQKKNKNKTKTVKQNKNQLVYQEWLGC